jgi:hypothetical protein
VVAVITALVGIGIAEGRFRTVGGNFVAGVG